MKIRSDFALLDVKYGRHKLLEKIGFSNKPKCDPIPVVIHGEITGAWGNDDGISREFEVIVGKVELQ